MSAQPTAAQSARAAARRPSVLILDDEEIVLESLKDTLRESCVVAATLSPREALEWLAARPYDILLSDIMMEEMDGLEVIRRARVLQPELTAIVVTGYGTLEVAVAALREGVWDFLEKPLLPDVVVQTVARAWRMRRAEIENRRLVEELKMRNEELLRLGEVARLQQEQQLFQASRMVSLGTLVAGVAHEINNPNNFIMLNAPFLREVWQVVKPMADARAAEQGDFPIAGQPYTRVREEIALLFNDVIEGARRIKHIVDELRSYAGRDPSDNKCLTEINAVVASAVALVAKNIKSATANFSVSYGENLPKLYADAQRLEQVVINLVQNSCQALTSRDRAIEVSTRYDGQGRNLEIRVRDEGVGIPPENLSRLTDPFFTTKRDAGGTGLGLSVSATIVKNHGGTLEFISEPGRGTTVLVNLPISKLPPAS